jgi:hypothetical protein
LAPILFQAVSVIVSPIGGIDESSVDGGAKISHPFPSIFQKPSIGFHSYEKPFGVFLGVCTLGVCEKPLFLREWEHVVVVTAENKLIAKKKLRTLFTDSNREMKENVFVYMRF